MIRWPSLSDDTFRHIIQGDTGFSVNIWTLKSGAEKFNFYLPNSPKLRGARKGRTGVDGDSSALHFTTGFGQAVRSQGGQAGHTVGGAHFTSGQRGRGHAGHSPQSFPQAELSTMIGSGLGMELLRTYWERSGVGGHSVFSM